MQEGLEASGDMADIEFFFVGCLPVEIDSQEQEVCKRSSPLERFTNSML